MKNIGILSIGFMFSIAKPIEHIFSHPPKSKELQYKIVSACPIKLLPSVILLFIANNIFFNHLIFIFYIFLFWQ